MKKQSFWSKLWHGAKRKAVTLLGFSSTLNGGMENYFDVLNLRTFRESLYLFIGVSMIRETVSSIPLELYKITNKDGETEELLDDPLLDLLMRPNEQQTQKEFMKLAVAYYLLAGETFWYLERTSPTADPTAVVNLRPDNVEIVFSADKTRIVAYEFAKDNGEIIKLRPEDVLHIKNIDPVNPIRGVGVVRPATQRIITEKEAAKHQANTFYNQGRPDIAVFTNADLTEEDAEENRLRWQKVYGKDKGSQAGFFGQDIKDIKLLNALPKDMDFINSMNFLRDDILAALHVPKAMITSDDVNLANSKTARVNYLKEAVMPVLDTFIDILNNRLISDGDQRFFAYESPVQEDRELLLKEATELKSAGIISANEGRGFYNLDPVDDPTADALQSSGGLGAFQLSMKKKRIAAIARKYVKSRRTLVKKFAAVEAMTNMLAASKQMHTRGVIRQRNSVFNTAELKEKYIKAFNDNIDAKTIVFKDTIDFYNDALYGRIVKQLEEIGLNSTNFLDASTEMREAMAIFSPLMQTMFRRAGQETMDSIANGFSGKASENFFAAEALLRSLELRAEFFVSSMLDTDYKELQQIILQGMTEGKGIDVIARRLRNYFDDMSVSRAKTIARTETGRLISQATNEAYKQSAVVTGKEWLTSKDGKVRNVRGTVNDHVINDGKIVATDGVFPNGEQFPGQLTINCRCALAPAV